DLMELAPKLAASGFRYPDGGVDPWGVVQPRRSKPLVVAVQGTSRWAKRVPRAAGWTDAMRYILTGDEFDADEALRMRLLTEVVEPGEELAR
ncbi:enoyl-CoA hydratase, partial [Pseudomonas aeruginosa]|nr:enoyl-CoA hydratase [Pseudomonas aeruginosa]